jgi:hypothetical protein
MIPRHLQITFALLVVGVFFMAAYVLNLKDKAAASLNHEESRPVAPPIANPPEPLILYVAYDDEGVLLKRTVMAPLPTEVTARAREVLRALLSQYLEKSSPHPIGEGSDVKEVFLVKPTLAVVDMNAAFADRHRSGVWEEALTVDSMVATLAANVPGITKVKILIEGQERETLAGHADLMSVYDVAEVDQLIHDLQSTSP